MDGKNLKRRLRILLNESSDSSFIDARTSFDYLYEAAKEWVRRTHCLTTTQTITTVEDTAGYTLNGDFLCLYLRDDDHNYYVVMNDGSDNHFITDRDYSEIIFADQSDDSQAIPDSFAIIDDSTLDDQVTGSASADGDETGGKSTLTVSTALLTDVTSGDIVHNTTDGSDGVVIAVASDYKSCATCLFGGTDNEWDSADAFIIQPRGRAKMVFDPPPSTDDYEVTVYYVQSPQPVYSDYDVYRIPHDYTDAIVKYAYWLYKYRDKERDFGDSMYKFWESEIRKATASSRRLKMKRGFKVNLSKRAT